jgi:hypothetical protein
MSGVAGSTQRTRAACSRSWAGLTGLLAVLAVAQWAGGYAATGRATI